MTSTYADLYLLVTLRAGISVFSKASCTSIQECAEWFANQMRVCVNRTVNLRCAICKRFTYHLPRTKICQFFERIQRELDMPGVLCLPQVHGKLINHAPNTRCTRMEQCVSGVLVYTRFKNILLRYCANPHSRTPTSTLSPIRALPPRPPASSARVFSRR